MQTSDSDITPATEASKKDQAEEPDSAITAEAPVAELNEIIVGPPVVEAPESDPAETELRAILEAVVYVTDEPLSAAQIAQALGKPTGIVETLLNDLAAEYAKPERGLSIREVAGGYKMGTKPEHHDTIRAFVKSLKPALKLSLAALETLAVIAYKQPITAPEIMEIRGVQGAGVLKTLLDRKLIGTAGRKSVIGKPILYKTTKEFLLQFGLKDLTELPTLKEFEELRRLAVTEPELPSLAAEETAPSETEPAAETSTGEPPEE
jgi:segregation and condensation protein B